MTRKIRIFAEPSAQWDYFIWIVKIPGEYEYKRFTQWKEAMKFATNTAQLMERRNSFSVWMRNLIAK